MTECVITWDIDPVIFWITETFPLKYYGLLFITGLLLANYFLKRMYVKEKIPTENLEKLFVYVVIGIVLGARLGHCFFYEPTYYLQNPLEVLLPIAKINGGYQFIGFQGLASHGGALGVLISLYLYSHKTKHSMIDTIDLMAVVAGLSAGFIRLANFMNSEIIGMPTTKPWAVVFARVDSIPRHPAQLYEAISYFIIFGVMMFIYNKKREKLKNGFFFGLLISLVFISRFIIEFIKEDQVDFENGMMFNMGQLLSLPYIFAGIGFIIYGLIKTKKDALS